MIEANKPKVFEDAISFSGSSGSGSAPVTDIPLTSINPEPADSTTASSKPLIKANLGAVGGIDPGSSKCGSAAWSGPGKIRHREQD